MANDVLGQIERANSLPKVASILIQRLSDLVRFLEARIRFAEATSEVEGVALAGLAKAVGTADSVVLLARRGHQGDVQILVRAIMEVAYRTVWMLAEDAEQEKRMYLLYYQDAYVSLGQIQKILADDPGNLLFQRLTDAQEIVEKYRKIISERFPEVEFGPSGKLKIGTSFLDLLDSLGARLTYHLVYPTLSSPTHGDIKALAHHAVLDDEGMRFPIHAERSDSTTGPFSAHIFLGLLASNVNDKIMHKLGKDFGERMDLEERISLTAANKANELRGGLGVSPRGHRNPI